MPLQDRSIRVEGVVLRHNDFGEADRLLVIYTRELGKLRAIAKGIRKPRSRKAGHVEPFTRSQIQLARGRDLFILTQAETVDVYTELRNDLILLSYASYIIELIDRSTTEEEEHRSIYNLLVRSLLRLNRKDNPKLVTRYFDIRLLDYVGFRPQLYHCAQCEAEIQAENQFFSAEQGGVICPRCGQHVQSSIPVSMKALKYLRFFQRSSYQDAVRASISNSVYDEMESLLQYYISSSLERRLNSLTFLRRVRSEED